MPHSTTVWSTLLATFTLALGCGPAASSDTSSEGPPLAPDSVRAPTTTMTTSSLARPSRHTLIEPIPDVLAWTKKGNLALVDGPSGVLRQTVAGTNLFGARTVVHDP